MTIKLDNLNTTRVMTTQEMKDTKGGWFFYYNVFNRSFNPFGWGLQNSWIQRGQMFDQQHNNFISFLRS